MNAQQTSPTARTSPQRETLDVHVAEMKQMFNAMDAAPFRERDLDPRAEEFIVEWARELRTEGPLGLVVHLGREAATPDTAATLQDAVREFFRDRAIATQRRLRQLLRRGRISLVIGVAFVAAAVVIGDLIASLFTRQHLAVVLQESLAIGGWVALWGPLDILLYEWWPVRAEVRLYDRLSAMVVEVVNPEPAPETAVMR
jgi:hypothetical protein